MDLQARKYQLIQALINTTNENIIGRIENLIRKNEDDFWDDLPVAVKNEIEQGLQDADKGKLKTHSEMLDKYKKWA